MTGARESTATFSERLWPGAGAWASVPVAMICLGFIFVPFGAAATIAAAATGFVLVAAALVLASPRVEVAGGMLTAGRARIEVELLGEPSAFTAEEARVQRGPGLDARAYLLIRGWIGPVVRVPVLDSNDPTPYWLISTRQPDRLVAALERG